MRPTDPVVTAVAWFVSAMVTGAVIGWRVVSRLMDIRR